MSALLKSNLKASSSLSLCFSYEIMERACSMSAAVISSSTSLLCLSKARCKLWEMPSTRCARIFSYLSAYERVSKFLDTIIIHSMRQQIALTSSKSSRASSTLEGFMLELAFSRSIYLLFEMLDLTAAWYSSKTDVR